VDIEFIAFQFDRMEGSMEQKKHQMIYGIDDKPPLAEGLILGFQHYLTVIGSTVAIPHILSKPLGIDLNTAQGAIDLASLISTMFFVSGITTLIQVTFGNRLPIIQGGTFSFIAPTFAICGMASLNGAGWQVKMQHVQGAIIVGAIFEMIIGYSGLVGKVKRFVGPITIAPTIALIGLALFKFGAPVAGKDWWMGGGTILLIILFSQHLREKTKIFKLFPILLALVIAWGVAAILTALDVFHGPVLDDAGNIIKAAHPSYVDTNKIAVASWFRIPYPFQWGWPQFTMSAIIGMLAGYISSMVESIGDYFACARMSGAPVPTEKTINRGIGTEGLGCLIAGVIGTGNGTTSYSENIGAIGLTRVGSRRVIQYGAGIMIVLGAVSKFGAIFTTIPQPIVGGMYCALFGMIASVGLSNLQFINLNSARNLFIIGFAFFMGLSLPEYFSSLPTDLESLSKSAPALAWLKVNVTWFYDISTTLGKTGMAVGGIFAFILDNTIPGTPEERGLLAWADDEK